ncbi:MAG: 2-oxoacid:ferredoxin oxidoreductase subunit gamma [Euryarchaeota archaeon]|nr:2-oxoacid:ferredoxin oxidoreductase subunit gamma [Euryarchaeota archaeon]
MNVCFSGLGGQGISLLGLVLGEAAARSGHNALQTQSYGAEARGGASYSIVIVSKERILDIAPDELDLLVAMSQPAHDRFSGMLGAGGRLFYESELVRPAGPGGLGIPATSLSRRHLGKELYANMVMLGFFVREGRAVDAARAREAVAACVPERTVGDNLKAFEVGYGHEP